MGKDQNLKNEFNYFLKNQEELVKKYNGKYIVIKEEKVIGDYETEADAYIETSKMHKVGTFLIQYCVPGEDSYTQTFHSRVAFQ